MGSFLRLRNKTQPSYFSLYIYLPKRQTDVLGYRTFSRALVCTQTREISSTFTYWYFYLQLLFHLVLRLLNSVFANQNKHAHFSTNQEASVALFYHAGFTRVGFPALCDGFAYLL